MEFKFELLHNWRHEPKIEDYGKEFHVEYLRDKQQYEHFEKMVLYENVTIEYESCDCSEYGCSHGSYPINIRIDSWEDGEKIEIEEYGDSMSLVFDIGNRNLHYEKPIKDWTINDFETLCALMDIQLKRRLTN